MKHTLAAAAPLPDARGPTSDTALVTLGLEEAAPLTTGEGPTMTGTPDPRIFFRAAAAAEALAWAEAAGPAPKPQPSVSRAFLALETFFCSARNMALAASWTGGF